MAAPCIITYNGKKYSYQDWITLLHDGELDKFISDGVVSLEPKTKQQRKDIANAKIDEIVDSIKGLDNIFGIKIKIDNIDGISKKGVDIVNIIASVVKQAVAAGIEIDEAIAKTIEHFKKSYDFDINPKDVKNIVEGVEEEQAETEEQKIARLTESRFNKSLREEIKALINPIGNLYYEKMPNVISEEMARELIDQLGVEKAKEIVLDAGNDLKGGVREQMYEILIARSKPKDKAFLVEKLINQARESARFLQAMGIMSKSPEGIELFMEVAHKTQVDEIANRDLGMIKELIEELARTKELLKKYDKKDTRKSKPSTASVSIDSPKFGENNRIVTKQRKEDIVKKLRGMSFANAVPIEVVELAAFYVEGGARSFAQISKKMIKDIGVKVKPFLKEAYQKARNEAIENGVNESEFSSDSDIDIEIKNAEDKVREAKLKSIAKAYEDRIANISRSEEDKAKLKAKKDQAFKDRGGYLEDLENFDDDTIREWGAKNGLGEMTTAEIADFRDMAERYNEQQAINKYKSLLGSFKNKIKNLAKEVTKTKADLDREQQERDKRKELNGGNLEDLDNLSDNSIRDWLAKKGFTDVEKSEVDAIRDLALEYKKEQSKAKLKSIAKSYESKIARAKGLINKRPVKKFGDKLAELNDLGALENSDIMELWAEANGLPKKLNAEDLIRLKELAVQYQSEESAFRKARFQSDMFRYIENLKGTSFVDVVLAVKYAHMLSSHMTHIRNFFGNLFEFVQNSLIAFRKPKAALFALKSLKHSLKRGWFEAESTFRTGYSPLRENAKVDIPSLLERTKFKGIFKPLNYYKYIRRLMVATDVLFYETNKEFSAYRLAYSKALVESNGLPTYKQVYEAMKNTGHTEENIKQANSQAELELESRVALIKANPNITAKEKEKEIAREELDKKLRVYELLEEKRDKQISRASSEMALQATYNNEVEGLMGVVATGINSMLRKAPILRTVLPFVNVPANIFNRYLDYTPYGIFRSFTPSGSVTELIQSSNAKSKREYANQKFYQAGRDKYIGDTLKGDLLAKGIAGTTLLALLAAYMWDDDDDDKIEIIGDVGDYNTKSQAQQSGIKPYTFRIGKKDPISIPYKLSTLAPTIAFAGRIHDYQKYKKEGLEDINSTETEMFFKKVAIGSYSVLGTIMDNNFLKEANDLIQAFSDKNKSKGLQRFFASNIQSTVLPNEIIEVNKGLKKIFNASDKETNQEFGKLLIRNVPFAEMALYPKINVLGEVVITDGVHDEKNDKIWNLMAEKGRWLTEPQRLKSGVTLSDKEEETYNVYNSEGSYMANYRNKQAAEKLSKQVGGSIDKENMFVEVPMTDEQWYAYIQNRGEILSNLITEQYDELKGLTPDEFKKSISALSEAATAEAKTNIITYKIVDGKISNKEK